jgi:ABC-type transport system involved in cytochrome bd biosynthesis fused ATPase/permease subunit
MRALRHDKKYVFASVGVQLVSLVANIVLLTSLANMLSGLYVKSVSANDAVAFAIICVVCIVVRAVCARLQARFSFLASRDVRERLRLAVFKKLASMGPAYKNKVSTSEAIQAAIEGIDQLDSYFGSYLPQFFYAMLAPVVLFVYIATINLWAALVLLICVPLIPIAIAAVQTFAKKLLGKYWGQYNRLGETFLENLQGLTTLKVYNTDARQHEIMNAEAESCRKITMRVLIMQLNSVCIMDLIAYGGAALGMILALVQLEAGAVSLAGALAIILLSSDFFIPMRTLGSFFHISMNGVAASDKIFAIINSETEVCKPSTPSASLTEPGQAAALELGGVSFSYTDERVVLEDVSLAVPHGSLVALVGESGSGKSTIAAIFTGQNNPTHGAALINGKPVAALSTQELFSQVTYIGHASYIFAGSVRDNLAMAAPKATDAQLWAALEIANLDGFMREAGGLDFKIAEGGANLSGGQRQRLALARALLHDTPIYIFDEATSNVDVESENDIMAEIYALARTKTVLLITHRLANVISADNICVLDGGRIVESGTHMALMQLGGTYERLFTAQANLEAITKKANSADLAGGVSIITKESEAM